tara:strand:+ start:114 stop:377 length:264 start_codon:yes stop_codon:yes gene_type:complete
MATRRLDFTLPAAKSGRARSEHSQVLTVPIAQPEGTTVQQTLEFFPDTPEGRAALMVVALQIGPQAVKFARRMLESVEAIKQRRQVS